MFLSVGWPKLYRGKTGSPMKDKHITSDFNFSTGALMYTYLRIVAQSPAYDMWAEFRMR